MRPKIWIVAGAILLGSTNCNERVNSGKVDALRSAQETFQDLFELTPRRSVYIEALHKADDCPDTELSEALYSAIWGSENTGVSESAYVYLNIRDGNGEFCFQLFRDPASGAITYSDQPYY